MYNRRKISVKELVREYLNRISEYDQKVPGWLNSILEVNPDAIAVAETLDQNRFENTGQLYGIPVLLKDNMATSDRMHTSAGSLALADSLTPFDADIAASLRKKGAVILGKTNMTEFSNFMSDGMKAGYSSRGGKVQSPYNKSGDPSGSSTGSAVSVTANFCTAAFGTDTSGSIITPAIKNGIVGFRPSAGTFSQRGIIPISFTLDTAGPMTRTVMDSIVILSELNDLFIPADDIEMGRITMGINQTNLYNLTVEEQSMTDSAIKLLEKSGVRVKPIDLPKVPKDKLKRIQLYEFKYSINRYLSSLPESYSIRSLNDIIEFNNLDPDRTLRYGQSLFLDAEQTTKGDLSEPEYRQLLQDRKAISKKVSELIKDVDICILTPNDLIMQYIGLPIITIPHGLYQNGMPFGICFTAFENRTLLRVANRVEQIIGNRIPPNLNAKLV
jgi:amidase